MATITLDRLTITYAIMGGAESAANSLHIANLTAVPTQDMADDLQTPVNTYWSNISAYCNDQVTVRRVRLDGVDSVTGRTIEGVDLAAPTGTGSTSGDPLPPQLSVVNTFRTALSGPRHRGRQYLPPGHTTMVTPTGRLGTTQRDAINGIVVAFLQAINLAAAASYQAVIFSRTAGGSQPIVRVETGDVYDTQRGRRRSLVEQRVGANL